MANIVKIFSAGILFCALSWSAGAFAQELAAAANGALDMKVSASCKNGNATFTVTNKGQAWPAVGNLSVYSTGITKLIHHRRMRFGPGQRVTFRVLGSAGGNAEIGLWVDPSWFKRSFEYDARIKCS